MDAAADDGAALVRGGAGGRHESADRRKDQRGIERLGRQPVRASSPFRAERAGEILRREVSGAGEGE